MRSYLVWRSSHTTSVGENSFTSWRRRKKRRWRISSKFSTSSGVRKSSLRGDSLREAAWGGVGGATACCPPTGPSSRRRRSKESLLRRLFSRAHTLPERKHHVWGSISLFGR